MQIEARATWPVAAARLSGLLYMLVIAGGAFAEAYVRQRLVVLRDPGATAANILANEEIWRLGFLADLFPLVCNVALAIALYAVFRAASRPLAGLAVFFLLVGSAIQAGMLLFHFAPLVLLKGGESYAALSEPVRDALTYLFVRLHHYGYTISLVFFGFFGLSIGLAILKATFFPRTIGALMVVAGALYATNSLLLFAAPAFASIYLLLPVLAGEGSLALWLLVMGVNAAKWHAQAAAAFPAPPSQSRVAT